VRLVGSVDTMQRADDGLMTSSSSSLDSDDVDMTSAWQEFLQLLPDSESEEELDEVDSHDVGDGVALKTASLRASSSRSKRYPVALLCRCCLN